MMDRSEIDAYIREVLENEFDCDPSLITDDANLFEVFDLDSIDAVDLVVNLQKKYNVSLSAEDFKDIRDYGGLVDVVHKIVSANS